MSQPFSVSMCVYGGDNPDHFRLAVNSIIKQTVQPAEVILVVDGSVPEELDKVIRDYEKQIAFFHVYRFLENRGHGEARRKGLSLCNNELVALMDADDISVENRFEKQLSVFNGNNKISIVGGNIVEFIGTLGNKVGARHVPTCDKEIKQYLCKRCPMNQVTVMFKKSAIEKVGGYIDWYCEEDYYLWLRLYLDGAVFANLDETLVYVRVGDAMYRRRGGRKYYLSEKKLQKFMLDNHIITYPVYCKNVMVRWVVQCAMPNNVRSWVFQRIARDKV